MLPDVQTRLPDIRLSLTRVGVNNVRKLLRIPLPGKKPIVLLATFDCFVDLPSSQKGTHMSRNLEAINEILEEVIRKPAYELEGICGDIAEEVLHRHDYATRCEVSMESKRMLHGAKPSSIPNQSFVKILAKARAIKGKSTEKEVGAEVRGIIIHVHKGSKEELGAISQRAYASLLVQVPGGKFINIDHIVEILENSFSAKAYGYLSEREEAEVMSRALKSRRSADGVVKNILREAAKRFELPDNAMLEARCVSEESLFSHNSIAERKAKYGDLKRELLSQKDFKGLQH